jgi:hypothetical protein
LEFLVKDPYRWQVGFALFGATLDDGYFVLWRRFNYRIWGNGYQETCRLGTTVEYDAARAAESDRRRKNPPPRK